MKISLHENCSQNEWVALLKSSDKPVVLLEFSDVSALLGGQLGPFCCLKAAACTWLQLIFSLGSPIAAEIRSLWLTIVHSPKRKIGFRNEFPLRACYPTDNKSLRSPGLVKAQPIDVKIFLS